MIGDLVRKENTSRMAVVLAALLRSGLPFVEAVRITRQTLRNRIFRLAMDDYEAAVTAGRIHVEIEDFISPTIIERLGQQAGVVQPKIDDWRAMVDCVMIDTAYGGHVFNAVLADIPEKKTDFVEGKYDLPAPAGETTVAVKIVDMLGEEVLTTQVLGG